jgi:glucose-1-phosphate thymidylyltransferase
MRDGVTSATIVVGYLGELVEKYVRTSFPTLKVDFVEQPELLGLGHSIWVARESIPSNGEPLLVILGDTIFNVELKDVFQLPHGALGVKPVEDPRRFGVAETEGGFVTHLVEKPEHPKTNLAIAGLYFFRNPPLLRECLDELVAKDIRTKNEYQLTDALQLMIDRGEKFATFHVEEWFDCGKPETLLETNRHLLDLKPAAERSQTIDSVIVIPPVYIAKDAHISNSVIGPYASIGSGATIDRAVIRDSVVGDSVEIKNILLESSIIGNSAIVRGEHRKLNLGDRSEVILA